MDKGIKSGIKNLLQNRKVSGLILFSIMIGVCSLFLLFSINETGKKEILKILKEKGNASILSLDSCVYTQEGLNYAAAGTLSFDDLRLLKNSFQEIKGIGILNPRHVQTVKIGNRQYPPEYPCSVVTPVICGINPEYNEVRNFEIMKGRLINKTDMQYRRRVCVLGWKMYERLGKGEVIGKKLTTNVAPTKFTIIGVLRKKMPLFTSLPDKIKSDLVVNKTDLKSSQRSEAESLNNDIYIPLTTWIDFQKEIFESILEEAKEHASSLVKGLKEEIAKMSRGDEYFLSPLHDTTFIDIKINIPEEGRLMKDEENLKIFKGWPIHESLFIPEKTKVIVDNMRKVLKKRYGEDKLFSFTYLGNLTDEIQNQMEDSNKLLWITGMVTLLLSGVILSSMMLMSVHKRVSEIGIRRAFGARKKDIFYQFLTEGMVIYSIGIVIGLVMGLVLSYLLIVKILSWEYSIPIYSLVLSSVIPFLVSILSSLYPAMQAAKIQPAVAVKYE